jgi:hypothetical protein
MTQPRNPPPEQLFDSTAHHEGANFASCCAAVRNGRSIAAVLVIATENDFDRSAQSIHRSPPRMRTRRVGGAVLWMPWRAMTTLVRISFPPIDVFDNRPIFR